MTTSYCYHVLWTVDGTEIQPEQAEMTLSSIDTQISKQTSDDIVTGRVRDFEITTGVAATYLIGVGSALTAQVIAKKLRSLSGTKDVEVKTEVDVENGEEINESDGQVDIDIDVSVDNK